MTDVLIACPEFAIDIAAGSVGGFCSKAFDYPFDTAKVLLQTQKADAPVKYKGTFDCLQSSVKQKGFASLYNGISSRLIGSMAENAVCFVAYAGIKRQLQDRKPQEKKLTYLDLSLAGAGSGAVVSFIMTPVELVKCRMQVSSQLATPLYKNSLDCVLQTVRQEGGFIKGLYQGHTSTLLREVPGNFGWYLTYELCCDWISHYTSMPREQLPTSSHMMAGACAGVMYWAAIFPVDTVKSVLQTSVQLQQQSVVSETPAATSNTTAVAPKASTPTQLTFPQALRSIYSSQGLAGLYRGFGVTALRSAPANAVLFAAYEQTCQLLK